VADPQYVNHFFQTPDYWAQIAKAARGVAQPGVNATTLKGLEVPIPSLMEQRRIATVLDKAEALRAKRRAALAKLGQQPGRRPMIIDKKSLRISPSNRSVTVH
jgi:type I restriction enzyme S subunit